MYCSTTHFKSHDDPFIDWTVEAAKAKFRGEHYALRRVESNERVVKALHANQVCRYAKSSNARILDTLS